MNLIVCTAHFVSYGQQNVKLKFSLKNSDDHMPVTFVKISLINPEGQTAYQGLTDVEGKYVFLLSSSLDGKLRVSINPIGYEGYTSSAIKFDKDDIIDTVYLSKRTISLDEVKIVQQQIVKDGEKLIYRPKLDQFSASTAGVELFSKLPGVSLIGRKLKLNGTDSVLLLIDGKGQATDQSQQMEILAALSSDKIEKIEILSASSSRYEAHVTSVINVITKKDKGNSTFRGNLSRPLYMDNRRFGNQFLSGSASTNLNFTVGKIRTSMIFNISNTRRVEDSEYKSIIYDVINYDYNTSLESSRFAFSPSLTMDYDINQRSSIGANVDISVVPSIKRTSNEILQFSKLSIRQSGFSGPGR